MKYLKTYEAIKDKPQIGDYALCKPESGIIVYDIINKLHNFIDNNIGKNYKNTFYNIRYNNIPEELKNFFYENTKYFHENDILQFSSNKEELEAYIQSKKYNL